MIKILYVEDELFLAKIVKESLERADYEVLHISNGGNALNAFKNFDPDLCVLDVMLPQKNGFEIAREIKGISHDIPIIFLTAKNQTEDVITGFKSGGNDYIKKPFSMEELIIRIENLMILKNQKVVLKDKFEGINIGSKYIFYPGKYQLNTNDKSHSLSHKESQILELFCANINGIVQRKDILFKAWGDDSYFNSRNLDVYIRKIRKYLSEDDKVRIVTLKGVGYHFVVE